MFEMFAAVQRSGPGMLESTIYYDNSGNKIGVSEISPLGGTIYYEIRYRRSALHEAMHSFCYEFYMVLMKIL